MQATETTRRFDGGQIKLLTAAAGLLASLVVGAAVLALTDQLPSFGGSGTKPETMRQISSDELFALEASLAASQVNGWQATVGQMTSDEAFAYEASVELARAYSSRDDSRQLTSDEGWALEAAQMAAAAAVRNSTITQLTSDEAWTIEQAQLLAGSAEQRSGR